MLLGDHTMLPVYVLVFVVVTLCDASPTLDESNSYTAACPSFCDMLGRYRPAKICIHHSEVYCCGYQSYLYCCPDRPLSVQNKFDHVTSCPGADFWYHWRMSVSLVTTMLIIMMCTACCYYCCVKGRVRSQMFDANRVHSDRTVPNISQTITLPDGSEQQVFNPAQPYAFAPPQYDTLPKEPPKYVDAMHPHMVPAAHTNEGFEQSQSQITTPSTTPSTGATATIDHSELPPVYSEHGQIDESHSSQGYNEHSSPDGTQVPAVSAQSASVQ